MRGSTRRMVCASNGSEHGIEVISEYLESCSNNSSVLMPQIPPARLRSPSPCYEPDLGDQKWDRLTCSCISVITLSSDIERMLWNLEEALCIRFYLNSVGPL